MWKSRRRAALRVSFTRRSKKNRQEKARKGDGKHGRIKIGKMRFPEPSGGTGALWEKSAVFLRLFLWKKGKPSENPESPDTGTENREKRSGYFPQDVKKHVENTFTAYCAEIRNFLKNQE